MPAADGHLFAVSRLAAGFHVGSAINIAVPAAAV
jgi:hypothetical protein